MSFRYDIEPHRHILCVDLKSFYASVECVDRKIDPLKSLLVVMSTSDTGGGLVLAASPAAKTELGISNVSRQFELPDHPKLIIAPPRMNLYIKFNMQINEIFRRYVSDADLHIYSIDESFLDVTSSLKMFNTNADGLARMIQIDIYRETGLYCTIGIGDNPLLAKLALDNAAKKNSNMRAEWRYEDVPNTIWKIEELTDFWGIGGKMKIRLNKMGISNLYELAHRDYFYIKDRLGMIGAQLFAHSWGIDRSQLTETYKPKEKSYGNSQVLMRDYCVQSEIEIVIREIAEQVASRIRRHDMKTQTVSLRIGYSHNEVERGFSKQKSINATSNSKELSAHCIALFRDNYKGQTVRNIAVSYSKLVHGTGLQLNIFEAPEKQIDNEKLDQVFDLIRAKYGFSSIVRASSTMEGATAISRSQLVGGHAGGLDGLE